MQGIGFPLGLMNVRHRRREQRDKGRVRGGMRKEAKGSRAVEEEKEEKKKRQKDKEGDQTAIVG